MEIIKLKFKTPYKITSDTGQLGDVDEYIHSDTLTGAIWSLWNWLYPESFEKILPNNDEAEPKFKISSAFFCKGELYFFPIPLSTEIIIGNSKYEVYSTTLRKKKKKITYLEKNVFQDALKGKVIKLSDLEIIQEKFAIYKKDKEKVGEKIFVKFEKERNVLDRLTDTSKNIYFSNEIKLVEDAALFFIAKFESEEIKKQFLSVLRLLGDEGIGADRKIGKGLFNVELDYIDDFENIKSNHFLNLSLFNPPLQDRNNLDMDNSYYDLLIRGGWITQAGKLSKLKQNVKMLKEGSVINMNGSFPEGRAVNLSPHDDEEIWRAGYFVGFPIKLDEE